MKKRIFTLNYAIMLAWLFLIPTTLLAQLPNTTKGDYSTKSGTFTDTRDGKTYAYKKYGDYEWFTQNLNYVAPGSFSPYVAPGDSYLHTPREGYDAAVDADGSIFGRYYCMKASTADLDGLCPDGWRLPDKSNWEQLFTDIVSEYELTDVTSDLWNSGIYIIQVQNSSGFESLKVSK